MDIKQIENLLEKAEIIKKKYDDLAEYTGENFNVFNILRLNEKELIHSAFIANLLNAKGNHGQKDVFLKLFLNEIKKEGFIEESENKKRIEGFDTSKSSAKEEEYVGRVDYERVEGGRIDIVIKEGNNVIVIENKIGAGDQEAQLFRYYNHYKESPIIYLTPFGNEPSEDSKGKLENNKDFICISYEQHIVNWIEKCIKEMANKPIIRETLNQYLHLTKQITNQTTNNKMEQELTDLILGNEKNYNAYETLMRNQNEIHRQLISDSVKIFVEKVIKVVAEKHNLESTIDEIETGNVDSGVDFFNESLLGKGFRIRIQFLKNLQSPFMGYSVVNDKDKNESLKRLEDKFREEFHNVEKEEHGWFIFRINHKSNDMAFFNNIEGGLISLKFKEESVICDLKKSLDNIVGRILEIVKNEHSNI